MNLLFIGDVMGRPGREAVREFLPTLRKDHEIDAVVANGENLAGGKGLTQETAEKMFDAGVDILTGGNHLFDKRESLGYIQKTPRIVRPANYPPGTPGNQLALLDTPRGKLAVGCVLGRVYMKPLDDPFRAADELVDRAEEAGARFLVMDVHAEATSEKVALGVHLDGRASLVAGTHTHVPTADERVLPGGTAYVTDAGMTGAYDSVIGMEKTAVVEHFRSGMHQKFQTATDDVRLFCILADLDDETGRARSVMRIQRRLEEETR